MMVTYHHPDARLRPYLEKTPFSRTDALESLKLLVNSVNFCGAALVWSWADGLNPVLLSGKSKIFIADLIKKLGPELVDVIEVNSENRLPEW